MNILNKTTFVPDKIIRKVRLTEKVMKYTHTFVIFKIFQIYREVFHYDI